MSNMTELIPEFAKSVSIWGGCGWLLKTLHCNGAVPYWACISITNVIVRTSLLPLVLQSAHTSARIAKVAPEVQFLVTIFQNDLRKMRAEGRPVTEQTMLFGTTWKTLRGIYKLHKVSPLSIFKAPLMQLPIFWYFSVDLRKIIHGADPELAQQLADSNFLWITDLTDPDPFYGLPILGGALLYFNVEVAVGRKSLSGEAASKSKIAMYMKDFFQSLAVFMPCFMAQSPAGVQIYLCTSFVFTLFQGAALRNDAFRQVVGLPTASSPKPEATLAQEFIALKQQEEKAKTLWKEAGYDEVQGKGSVLASGFETSFPGTARPSTIKVSSENLALSSIPQLQNIAPHAQVSNVDSTPKVYAPPEQFIKQEISKKPECRTTIASSQTKIVERTAEELMEAANRGELLEPMVVTTDAKPNNEEPNSFNAKKFVKKRRRKGGKSRRKK